MDLESHLDRILREDSLTALFQPIMDFSRRRIFGFEGLIRGPSNSPLHAPINLFDAAAKANRVTELDLLCRSTTIQAYAAARLPGRLFLNVNPEAVEASDHRRSRTQRFLEQIGVRPDQIVIEITEHQPIDDYSLVRRAISHYRNMGFTIAIDDLGAGYASLRHWSELRPDFVKIDRHFIEGVDTDRLKQEFVRSILDIANGAGTRVIAEGIETAEEYRCLWTMGVSLGQGYYFARPGTRPPRHFNDTLPEAQMESAVHQNGLRERAEAIRRPVPAIAPDTPVDAVARQFRQDPEHGALVVLDEAGFPLGLALKDRIQALYASDYGRALYARSSVRSVMDSDVLKVPVNTPLDQLSQLITEQEGRTEAGDNRIFLLIEDDGHHAGMGFLIDLLRTMTDLKIQHARHANPLTQLPGNVPINRHLDNLLSSGRGTKFVAVYADLDHFKPYNDEYGYARGDDVLVSTSRLLRNHLNRSDDFLGHIGGDDFMFVLHGDDWEERCRQILDEFAMLVPWFYNAADRKAGGHMAVDRQGKSLFFPLISLSMGALPVSAVHQYASHQVLAGILSELKREAKKMKGNSLFVDRRSHREPRHLIRAAGDDG